MTKYLYKSIESLENQDETMPNWYRPKIDAKLLKKLSKRSNGPAWINTILYFGVLLLSGSVAYLSWRTWWLYLLFLSTEQFILLMLFDGMNMSIFCF